MKESNTVRLLAESFYVDDFVSGALTTEEGFSIYQKAKEIMKQGEFNLCKWKANDEIPKGKGHGEVKLWGPYWSTLTDKVYFDFKGVIAFVKTLPPTNILC